jgi:hypothetical protein
MYGRYNREKKKGKGTKIPEISPVEFQRSLSGSKRRTAFQGWLCIQVK